MRHKLLKLEINALSRFQDALWSFGGNTAKAPAVPKGMAVTDVWGEINNKTEGQFWLFTHISVIQHLFLVCS